MVFDYKDPLNQAKWEPVFPFEEFRGFKVEIDNIHQYLDQNQPYNLRKEFSKAFQDFKGGLVDLIEQALSRDTADVSDDDYSSLEEYRRVVGKDYNWLVPQIKEITKPLLFPTILLYFSNILSRGGHGEGWVYKNDEPVYFEPHGTEVITDYLISAALINVAKPLEDVIHPIYGIGAPVSPFEPLKDNITNYILGTLGILTMQEIEDILNDFDLVDEEKIRSSWNEVHEPVGKYVWQTYLQRYLYDAFLNDEPKTIIDYLEESYAQDLEFNREELGIQNQADFNKWVNYAYGLAILTFQMHVNGEQHKIIYSDANESTWTSGLRIASIDPDLENIHSIISKGKVLGGSSIGSYFGEKWEELESQKPKKSSLKNKLKIFGRR